MSLVRPMARGMVRPMARAMVWDSTIAPAVAPDAYADGQWSVTHTGISNQIKITVTGTPNLNGNTQTGMEYRIDGGTAHTTALVGSGDVVITDAIELVDDAEVDVQIRVDTAEYTWGAEEGWSTAKPVTPNATGAAVPDAIATFALTPEDGALGVTFTLPADNGSAITSVWYRVDSGTWTNSGGVVPFSIPGLTNGVEYDVELYAVNGVGAGPPSSVQSATPATGDTLADGLTGHYAFEDDVTDSSTSGYDGTAINSPSYITGVVGTKAISLNGTNQRVELGDVDTFDGLSAFSLSIWVNLVANSGVHSVVRKDGTFTPLQFHFGDLWAAFWGGPTVAEVTSAVPGTGAWHHVVMRWDKSFDSGKVEYFVDGVSVGTSSAGFTSDITTGGSNPIVIGGTESGGELVDGALDDVRFYNRRVTDIEVAALYALGAP